MAGRRSPLQIRLYERFGTPLSAKRRSIVCDAPHDPTARYSRTRLLYCGCDENMVFSAVLLDKEKPSSRAELSLGRGTGLSGSGWASAVAR